MTARRVAGACPQGGRLKIRHRNQKSARAALDAARQLCRKDRRPEALWPVTVYRCERREHGGCGGWHLACSRPDVENYLRDTLRHGLTELFPPAAVAA